MSDFDRQIAARTIYGEARGESQDGKRAVMHVLLNRLNGGRWNTLAAVCMARKQFSCWNDDDPNRLKMCDATDAELADCFAAFDDPGSDLTFGATNYHTLGVSPLWATTMQYRGLIGNHVFYKEAVA